MSPNWVQLTRVLIDSTTGVGITVQVVGLLAELLLKVKNEEIKRLQAIQKDVQALIGGPFNAAMLHIEEAQRAARRKAARPDSFRKAIDSLYLAHGVERPLDLGRGALIEYYIADTWVALADYEEANTWFERSYQT